MVLSASPSLLRRIARLATGGALTLALLAAAPPASAASADPDGADALVLRARHEGLDDFCARPGTPLSPRARSLCPMAARIPECEAFVAACEDKPLDLSQIPRWNLGGLLSLLGSAARGVVWLAVALVIGLLVVFVASALGRARRDARAASTPTPKANVSPDPVAEALEVPSDAEGLLQRAHAHAARGELDRAALLYLAAALRALDRRGAIRIARHRTNGEYVLTCKEADAVPQLRAIVRAVDRVQFGHEPPTPEGVADVAARAAWIVRAVVVASMALLLAGCTLPTHGPLARGGDPEGDDLFMAVLQREGLDVARLGSSLAALPIPKGDGTAPLLVLDTSRTPLEDETRAHLERWVRAGGELLLAGDVGAWPQAFGARAKGASATDVTFSFPDPAGGARTDESTAQPAHLVVRATVAEPQGLTWDGAFVVARTGDDVTYAAAHDFDEGLVIALAGDDLLTNAGISVPPNARAIVGLLRMYAGDRPIRVALPQDGIAPPSNPLSSLLHAGLGLALAHAAFATALLMLAFGIRQSRARSDPPAARRAWTEHVAATGTLYARARLAPHALQAYARFVDARVRARMPRSMTDPAAFLALHSGADAAHCARVWALATGARSADRPRGDELTTLRDLHALYAAAVKSG